MLVEFGFNTEYRRYDKSLVIPLYDDYMNLENFSVDCRYMGFPFLFMNINYIDKFGGFGVTKLEIILKTGEVKIFDKHKHVDYTIKTGYKLADPTVGHQNMFSPEELTKPEGDFIEISVDVRKDNKKIKCYLNKKNGFTDFQNTFKNEEFKNYLYKERGDLLKDIDKTKQIKSGLTDDEKTRIIKTLKEMEDE